MDGVDLVKATSVVLVVLMHMVQTTPLAMGEPSAPIAVFWGQVGGPLEPLRMPIFFVVSGLLAAGAVHRPWNLTRRRTNGIVYLYLLWSAILVAALAVISPDPISTLANLPATVVFAETGYWYLPALVVFFVIALAARNLPPVLVVTVAAVPNLLRPLTHDFTTGLASPWTADTP